MPLIQVTATQGTLTKDQQDDLMARVSDAVLRAERAAPDDPAAQSLVWAYYHEMPEGGTYIGGKNIGKTPLRVAVTTPQGALDAESRKALVADIGAVVDDLVGPFEGRLNHWTMLYELDEGGWGGGGQIFGLADIQGAMNIPSVLQQA